MSLDIACERLLETLKGQIHNDKSNAECLLWLFIHFRRLKNSHSFCYHGCWPSTDNPMVSYDQSEALFLTCRPIWVLLKCFVSSLWDQKATACLFLNLLSFVFLKAKFLPFNSLIKSYYIDAVEFCLFQNTQVAHSLCDCRVSSSMAHWHRPRLQSE